MSFNVRQGKQEKEHTSSVVEYYENTMTVHAEKIVNGRSKWVLPDAESYVVSVSANGVRLKGQPIQIVVTKDDHTFDLDEEALEELLLHPRTRDKKVVVVSISGAFREGKSFLLDFFLRYLNAEVSHVSVHLPYLHSPTFYHSDSRLSGTRQFEGQSQQNPILAY